MNYHNQNILVFGGGLLQASLINQCKSLGIRTVVIDPDPEALAKDNADIFEVVGGSDFETTCKVIENYSITGIITSATDKPLVMMAQIAERYQLPFYSEKTAINCTDKLKMKTVFKKNNIPCATGKLIQSADEIDTFPVILKPLDNSGSRGVFLCHTINEAKILLKKTLAHTKHSHVLAEKVINGKEYSIEAIHQNGNSEIIQITEKLTTSFPSNVETGHISPTILSSGLTKEILSIIKNIAQAFSFKDCASHTELKIDADIITIIETSPRLGGDFITSHLVPLSTGFNIEQALINIALGNKHNQEVRHQKVVGVFYFQLPSGILSKTTNLSQLKEIKELIDYNLSLSTGDFIPIIENSLERYGHFIIKSTNRSALFATKDKIDKLVLKLLGITPIIE